ncbi:TTL domain-containing protein [Phialemonium atrogriseum]|uniref:TTL domain-containing protein n=1 Tax=Phialemonium atrogriseum TaxID=1093897 RepID=A0AAJ0FFY0_9PEZI|nr:TTL domain-containing protein [Phialemonium atrogriseum]KAK1766002.1 TTL domain-containing protein [Phialemonium atrogriseum]
MHVYIEGACPWLDEHIKSFIRNHVSEANFIDDFDKFPTDAPTIFQFCNGWELNRNFAVLNGADTALINAYPNSDALARKDYLARVVELWTAKRPDSILKRHSPLTVRLSLDYAEYVDDALMAADDLTLLYSLEENAEKAASEREWWILKPALVDCGAGIRIFSTMEELASHLELVEYDVDDEDEEELSEEGQGWDGKPGDTNGFSPTLSLPGLDSLDGLIGATGAMTLNGSFGKKAKKPQYVFKENGRIPSAQMREFVAQRYIVSIPLLEKRKWHVRAYVLSVGRLKVHVFREMLALLAVEDYEPPWDNPSLRSSLTNTALQDEDEFVSKESMRDFWATPDDLLPGDWKNRIFDQICGISAELFRAAAHTMADKFTTMDKCFELFALDFLIDTNGSAWLLEVNETPAFYEHGVAGPVALRLMESVICVAMEHMGKAQVGDARNAVARRRMVEVLDETEKLAKSNITEILPES